MSILFSYIIILLWSGSLWGTLTIACTVYKPQSHETRRGVLKGTLKLFGCSYLCVEETWMGEHTFHPL